MNTATAMTKKVAAFRDWLSGCGAQVLEPTNEWEIARFKAGDQTCVIYRNKVGGVRYSSEFAEQVWKAFTSGAAWRAAPATKRRQMTPHKRSLLNRDGDLCFFCQAPMSDDNMTVEHLVAITHGGPNHISNLFLAHRGCNVAAGRLSAPEKIRMHVHAVMEKRRGDAKPQPRAWRFVTDSEVED